MEERMNVEGGKCKHIFGLMKNIQTIEKYVKVRRGSSFMCTSSTCFMEYQLSGYHAEVVVC